MQEPSQKPSDQNPTGAQRLDRWKRKLLDLSLRNRLINFRETKKSLMLQCPDISLLEDSLSGGAGFRIIPFPENFEDVLRQTEPQTDESKIRESVDKFLLDGMKNRILHVKINERELNKRLTETYRSARLSLEESGAITLFLTLGFLSWFESDSSTEERIAPLLLLPLEIERQSVKEGYRIKLADQDPMVNLTLLEKLKQDFRIQTSHLEEMPEDDSGLDISTIMAKFEETIMPMGRWRILREACVGIFSFTKFLMWLDLEARSNQLMNNEVIHHLIITPNEQFDSNTDFPKPEELDKARSPQDTFCPLDADSTQLCAIYASQDNKTFLIEGPPGTGKSQTISNLIAHCLAHGKRVLFVAEKMAALDVVHNRLSKVGLAPFCLELHSNKARKMDVLKQLGASLEMAGAKPPSEWEKSAGELASLRERLNRYVDAVYKPREFDENVFRVISKLIGLIGTFHVNMNFDSLENFNAEKLAVIRALLKNLPSVCEPVGDIASHPLRSVGIDEWNQELTRMVEKLCGEFIISTDKFAQSLDEITGFLGFTSAQGNSSQHLKRNEVDDLVDAVRLILQMPDPPLNLPNPDSLTDYLTGIPQWLNLGMKRDELRRQIFAYYSESLLKTDLNNLLAQFENTIEGFFIKRWIISSRARKTLKPFALEQRLRTNNEIISDLKSAIELGKFNTRLKDTTNEAFILFGSHWNKAEADWTRLRLIFDWAVNIGLLLDKIRKSDYGNKSVIEGKLLEIVSVGKKSIGTDIRSKLESLIERESDFTERKNNLVELLRINESIAWGIENEPGYLNNVRSSASQINEKRLNLREWCFWRGKRGEVTREGIGDIINAFEHGEFSINEILDAFNQSFYRWWLDRVSKTDPVLAKISILDHQANIKNFRKLDQEYIELTRKYIPAKLASQVPVIRGDVSASSEVGILMRQLQMKRRHMPLRKLFEKIPNLVTKLKPCFLMSPLSVAQYFGVDLPLFDLIIFDEASQIPTWDAIGAIARGRKLIVVGDSKQLPPTTFFMKLEEGDFTAADETDYEDLESILDECVAARLPRLHLGWHYRSRHESLITFSNYNYYENRLLTFPSPVKSTASLGVSFRYLPEGIYDKGKSRTNRAEADAIVKEVITRLSNVETCNKSIGIVTFSIMQQQLVEDLLEEARRDHPEIDPYFTDMVPEPVFVKNLENVQGDERDIIMLSVCYGPDEQGRIAMNFGPLNRVGGERRLNVAITRSREQVIVFSSMRGDAVDLARTQSIGSAHLKSFLDYAENGPSALASMIKLTPQADFESPFEKEVYERIIGLGYDADIQVGCSGYRIDIAVKDKQNPGCYLTGIECDGANYHSAHTARDRDRLRESVLVSLGWRLHRVWSSDWWINPDQEVEKIKNSLIEAENNRNSGSFIPKGRNIIQHNSAPETRQNTEAMPQKIEPASRTNTRAILTGQEFYSPYKSPKRSRQVDDLYENASANKIATLLYEIVQQESPIHIDLALKRLLDIWGLSRATDKAKSHVLMVYNRMNPSVRPIKRGDFLWKQGQSPDSYLIFRVPGDSESLRDIDFIPDEEIANAIIAILQEQVGLPISDLARETANLFGFTRMNEKILERMKSPIAFLQSSGKCTVSGEKVSLG
jgi:very-short-patch-repair endonuclease